MAEKNDEKAAEQGNEQVQKVADEEQAQGFRGTETDLTDNEAYTVKGVTSNPQGVPEAQADPVVARREASNPELGRAH